MKEIYIIEYIYQIGDDGITASKINSDGFTNLEEARKWCARNGATADKYGMIYKWVENGDRAYIIHPITIK